MYSIFLSRWTNSVRKQIRHSIPWSKIPFGAEIFHHPVSTTDKNMLHQFSSKVLKGIFFGYALNAGCGWTGDLLEADAEEMKKNTASEVHVRRLKENEVGIQKRWRTILISMWLLFFFSKKKIAVNGPNHHATNPSPSYSNFLVEDISECLLEEEEDGSDLAKEQKTIWKRNMSSGASLKVSFNDIMVWTYQDFSCLEKNLFLFRWITWTLFDTFTRFLNIL